MRRRSDLCKRGKTKGAEEKFFKIARQTANRTKFAVGENGKQGDVAARYGRINGKSEDKRRKNDGYMREAKGKGARIADK